MQRICEAAVESQRPPGSAYPDQELNPAAKRLLLSAHLNVISKKLRRGLCVEAGEISALLPFTDGWRPNDEIHDDANGAPVTDSHDEQWAERLRLVGALP